MERNSPDHERYMKLAIASARRNPECPFGAVLVDFRRAEVVAEGYNRTTNNPTWHGEMDAINRYSEQLERKQWRQLHLYTTAEPCCMCQGAILWAEIPLVVYGTSIERLQQMGWKQIDIYANEVACRTPFANCQIVGGVLAEECGRLFTSAAKLRESDSTKGA